MSESFIFGTCLIGVFVSDAFAALFEAHKDRVYSIALRYSGNHTAALDIAQDAFLKLLSRVGDFRGEARFETWLFRVVVNSCMAPAAWPSSIS